MHGPEAKSVLARNFNVLRKTRDSKVRILPSTGIENTQMLLSRGVEAFERLSDVDAEEPKTSRVQAVVFADNVVALEINQVLVELIVAVQRPQPNLATGRIGLDARQGRLDALHHVGYCLPRRRRNEVANSIEFQQQPIVVGIVDRFWVSLDDLDAPLRIDVDQPFRLELADRFAHRIERRSKQLCQFTLRDELA